jgi:3'-phosphoadenosine 5'-phosphosulfate sulfotransferase (PAPS reductase)/FAD synthetase
MTLKMWEEGEDFKCLFTPAGNEPEELFDHIDLIMNIVKKDLIRVEGPNLFQLIDHFNALPNWRQRWCTRMIKIEPCIAYLLKNPNFVLLREGLFGDYAEYRYPLREWGWEEDDVYRYLNRHGIKVPWRTNCMLCPMQRLSEWYYLWRDYPEQWKKGEGLEEKTGYTFHSPTRDSFPGAMKDMRKLFEQGKKPRGADDQLDMWGKQNYSICRICSL